ncbi:MAG TPA: hypothetical protein DCP54_09465, partial [Chryseobacterium sp.]|nr:hypothetical protein [Chryseobacterium sp.]
MKTKLVLILLLFGLQLNLIAQAKHDYKPNCCRLAGAKFTMEKSCYCAGCAEVDEKNRQAKEAEDKRVKAVIAQKEEEKRQKAIAEQKKQNEKLAEQRKKDNENVVHLGFGNSDKKIDKTSITSINKSNITKEKLEIVREGNEWDGSETYYLKNYLINKNGEKVLTISNAYLDNLDTWGVNNNLYEIRERLDIGYDSYFHKVTIIDEKGVKRIKREDVVMITPCNNGFYLLQVPVWKSNIWTDGWGRKGVYAYYQYILLDAKNNKEYPLMYITKPHSAIFPDDDYLLKTYNTTRAKK